VHPHRAADGRALSRRLHRRRRAIDSNHRAGGADYAGRQQRDISYATAHIKHLHPSVQIGATQHVFRQILKKGRLRGQASRLVLRIAKGVVALIDAHYSSPRRQILRFTHAAFGKNDEKQLPVKRPHLQRMHFIKSRSNLEERGRKVRSQRDCSRCSAGDLSASPEPLSHC
jgi:hypothetical protein